MPDLRKGQYKRIGRIAETNPEKAERVADRMKTRASRGERGKNIANKDEIEKGFGTAIARHLSRGEESPNAKAKAVRDMTRRPDTPLAPSPEPLFRN
jgi:hypothetical protein